MTQNEKRELYERIMWDIAAAVKRHISEMSRQTAKTLSEANATKYDDTQMLSLDDIAAAAKTIAQKYSVKNIPEDDIRKAFVSYRDMADCRRVTHYGPDYIVESDSLEDDIRNLQNDLKRIYKFAEWQIRVDDLNNIGQEQVYLKIGYESPLVDVIIADIDDNEKIISEFMEKRGFMLVLKLKEHVNNFISFGHLMYTPVKQNNIREKLEAVHEFLYHIAPSRYDDEIQSEGILAKSRTGKSGIYYPPRVYLSYDKKFLIKYKAVLVKERTDEPYSLYTIRIKDLSPDIAIYADPMFGPPFVFTDCSVAPNLIIDTEGI